MPVDSLTLRPRRAEITHRGDQITVAHGKQFIHQLADKACLYTPGRCPSMRDPLEVNVAVARPPVVGEDRPGWIGNADAANVPVIAHVTADGGTGAAGAGTDHNPVRYRVPPWAIW